MALNEDNLTPCCIQAYGDGTLLLRDQRRYNHSVLITQDQTVIDWAPRALDELGEEHLAIIIAQKPDIVLLGTGETFAFPSPQTLAPLHQQRIGVECMDTAAACRSYVALFAESRNVLAALIL